MKKPLLILPFVMAGGSLSAQSLPNLDQLKAALSGSGGQAPEVRDVTPAAAPLPVAAPSAVEQLQQLTDEKRLEEEIKAAKKREKGPRRFASDLFDMRQLIGNNAEGGISEDYVLGTGDQIQVVSVGGVGFEIPSQIDGRGEVLIPKVGSVKVGGLPLSKARLAVQNKVRSLFSSARVDVSVTHLRQVRVFILGEVYKPGSYLVPSLSSIVNVLSLTGGPTAQGSFRQIRIQRGGKIVHTLDLYPLRAEGEGNMNFYLQSGDVVFVPLAFNQVMLEGGFSRVMTKNADSNPAEEIKTAVNLQQAVGSARVVQEQGLAGQTLADSIKNASELVSTTTPGSMTGTSVAAGADTRKDKILESALEKKDRQGALPLMQFELLPGETAAQALRFAGGLLPDTYQAMLALRRQDQEGLTNLTDIPVADLATFEMKKGDVLSAFPRRDRVVQSVSIIGWARVPGTFARKPGLRVGDLLKRDGQVLPDTYLKRGEIVRTLDDGSTRFLAFDLSKAMAGEASDNLPLEDRDRIELFQLEQMRQPKKVWLTGPLANAGEFALHEGMRVSDLLFQGGMPARSANRYYVELARSRYGKPSEVRRLENAERLFSSEDGSPVDLKDDQLNPVLQEDDRLNIYEKPDFRLHRVVSISGQVARPGSYVLDRENMTLSQLVERAGGLTPEAMPKAGVLFRKLGAEGRDVNQESAGGLAEVLDRLNETKMYMYLEGSSGGAGTPSVPKLFRPPVLHGLDISKLNRLVVDFDRAMRKDKDADVELENGDSVMIPRRTDSVMLIGETATPYCLYRVHPGMDVGDVLKLAGGTTRNADTSNIRLLKADGRIVDSWVTHRNVEPGDSILVPQRIRRDTNWQDNLQALTPIAILLNAIRK